VKYVDEFREARSVQAARAALRRVATRPWTIMEVCGGQTRNIVRYGLDQLLPPEVTLVHGPGCPVCVTPASVIDHAVAIAARPEVVLCSFGDMLRVPGNTGDLLGAKARGGDVRVVYSPLDALALARQMPTRQVVFLAVGFETTAPANALTVAQAEGEGLRNFSLLVSHVLVPPAMKAILASPANRVQGFLAAGHVCAVMGEGEYAPLASRYRVPIVVTGFEPLDIMQGIYLCVRQLEEGRFEVENQYARAVRKDGNTAAQTLVAQIFEVRAQAWRGIGELPQSGLGLRPRYRSFDAAERFPAPDPVAEVASVCQAGQVLTGVLKPPQCPAFGRACTPQRPLGAPMVSAEGACAAYFHYKRRGGELDAP
jgi:hydrogenase expression/formation protein HypD